MKQRFSEPQILGFLRDAAAGMPVMDLCWNHCFSRATFRAWQVKYGAAIDVEIGRLKELELENARLRKALANASSDVVRPGRRSAGAAIHSSRAKTIASSHRTDTPSFAGALHNAD